MASPPVTGPCLRAFGQGAGGEEGIAGAKAALEWGPRASSSPAASATATARGRRCCPAGQEHGEGEREREQARGRVWEREGGRLREERWRRTSDIEAHPTHPATCHCAWA